MNSFGFQSGNTSRSDRPSSSKNIPFVLTAVAYLSSGIGTYFPFWVMNSSRFVSSSTVIVFSNPSGMSDLTDSFSSSRSSRLRACRLFSASSSSTVVRVSDDKQAGDDAAVEQLGGVRLVVPLDAAGRVEDVDEDFLLRVDGEPGQVRADLQPSPPCLWHLPQCWTNAFLPRPTSPVFVRTSLQLLDHLLPVGVGQPAAQGEQLLRPVGDGLVRVGREGGLLVEGEQVEPELALLDGVEERRRRLRPGEDDPQGVGPGGRRQVLELPDDRGPDALRLAGRERVEEAGGELRGRPLDGGDECGGRRVALRLELDHLPGGGEPGGVGLLRRRRRWRAGPSRSPRVWASRPFTPQVAASLRSRPREVAGSRPSNRPRACSASGESSAGVRAVHPAARPGEDRVRHLRAISTRRGRSEASPTVLTGAVEP